MSIKAEWDSVLGILNTIQIEMFTFLQM
jgi:hypothetical protein